MNNSGGKRFENKVVLVTGSASGIGRACALAYAREGAKLALADLNGAEGNATLAMVQELGSDAFSSVLDIADAEAVERFVAQAAEKWGRLDVALNNAGIEGVRIQSAQYTEAAWNQVLSVNLTGTWLCMKYELLKMLEYGAGSIVNTASIAGLVGLGGLSAYTASKHAIVGLTKAAALEYAKKNIRVNSICPGLIKTPMVCAMLDSNPHLKSAMLAMCPQGRMGEPDEVAQSILWLSSDQASYVNGHALVVDGGWTAQ